MVIVTLGRGSANAKRAGLVLIAARKIVRSLVSMDLVNTEFVSVLKAGMVMIAVRKLVTHNVSTELVKTDFVSASNRIRYEIF